MHIKTSKQDLAIATNRLQGAISERTLANIGLKVDQGQLTLSAMDRVLAIYSEAACTTEQPGTVFVPAKLFSDVVKELPNGVTSLETKDSFLIIKAGEDKQFEIKIPVIDEMTWRDPPEFDEKRFTKLPTMKLSYMIEQMQFCVSQESPRNYGTVGYLHKTSDQTLRLVGTDGYRLSHCEITLPLPNEFLAQGVCLSKRALTELHRMCTEGFENIEIAVDHEQNTLLASLDGYKVFIRISAVKYPNYQGVLPKGALNSIEVSRQHLQGVAKRVLLASDKSRALRLLFSDNTLTLSSKTMGSSEGKELIQIDKYDGEPRKLAVNGRFLTDVFSATTSAEIEMQFKTDNNDALVILPKNEPEGCHSMHVLVPIKEN